MTPPTPAEWRQAHALRPLLWHVAKRHHALTTGAVGVEDLVQVGTIGAARAVRTYDPAKGALVSHMARRAEAEMVTHARRHGGPMRMPYGQAPASRASADEWSLTHPHHNPWPAHAWRLSLSALVRPTSPDDAVLLGWAAGWYDREQGARLGVSGERVRQRRAKALRRMRQRLGAA